MQENDKTDELTLDTFKVLNLLKDPAFYASLIPVLMILLPTSARVWLIENQAVLIPLGVVLAGHFGVRIMGVKEVGAYTQMVAMPIEVIEIPNDASGLEDNDE